MPGPRSLANRIEIAAISAGLLLFATLAEAQTFRVATPDEAADVVTADDPYMRGLTPADLSIRLKRADGGTPGALKAKYVAALSDWAQPEVARLAALTARNRKQLASLSAWLPDLVLLIKSTPGIDGGLPHTRANAIVFGPALPAGDAELEMLFYHELFHVLSRHATAATRESLYGLIGFERCTSLTLPADLRSRGISNPDVEDAAFTVEVQGPDEPLDLMPFLRAHPARYDPAQPSFPSYFQLVFLNMQRGPDGACSLIAAAGVESMFAPDAVRAPLYAKVGRNTQYVLHAEETLADNFAYLMTGRTNLPDMWLIESLRKRLAQPPG